MSSQGWHILSSTPSFPEPSVHRLFCSWVGLDRVRGLVLTQGKRQAACYLQGCSITAFEHSQANADPRGERK